MEDGDALTVHFSGGARGEHEAGDYKFWSTSNGSHTVRRPGDDPGERFRKMKGEKGYEKAWKAAITTESFRLATKG